MPYLCRPKVIRTELEAMHWGLKSLGKRSVFTLHQRGWARAEKPAPLLVPCCLTPPVLLSLCVPPSNNRWGSNTWSWWYMQTYTHSGREREFTPPCLWFPYPYEFASPFWITCALFGVPGTSLSYSVMCKRCKRKRWGARCCKGLLVRV